MKKEIICVICPSSCHVTVEGENGTITEMTGFSCRNGETYARDEFLAPKRTLTSTVKAIGYAAPVIPVRSTKPIPKELLLECMKRINEVQAEAPFVIGKVVIENILNTGTNIIITNC
jgi:CxxC motif-containing protein